MYFKQIFEPKLAQYAYIIGCQETKEAIVIDPMRDIDRYINIAKKESLNIVAATETHIHADFLSGLKEFAERLNIQILVSDEGTEDWKYDWVLNGNYNSRLLKNGDEFQVGNIRFEIIHTPGHTPEHICFVVSDLIGGQGNPMGIISGDFVFVGDVGRPDLLESAAGMQGAMIPSAKDLFNSLQKFNRLQKYLQLWPGHGAGSACGKALGAVPVSTVGYELMFNSSIQAAEDQERFIDYILGGQPEPPMYFARMKFENKSGPGILGEMPAPTKCNFSELFNLSEDKEAVIIDTRTWENYKTGHIRGSIFAPVNNAFNTTVGSYVTPDMQIYLITENNNVSEAVINLIRIGLDNIVGYFKTEDLNKYKKNGGELTTTADVSAEELKEKLKANNLFLLDVRRASELSETGYIQGAYNIAHTQLHSRFNEIPKDKFLMVQCRSGDRSRYASSFLERQGYEIANVAGGILEWIEKGNKIEMPVKE